MRAVELPAHHALLRLVERAVPVPGPGEVRVRVSACGVCGSDVFLQDGGFATSPVPIVPGHEAAGVVDALGPGVDDLSLGTEVAIYYMSTPPGDRWAAAGVPNRSPAVTRMGVDVDGAFAEYVVRPREALLVPRRPLPAAELAVLTDAVATPVHALRRIADVRAGETVAVIGIGGLGSNAIQLAKAYGATAIAITRSSEKRELALRLGADHALPVDEGTPDAVRELTSGAGADVVLQCADAVSAYQMAFDVAGPGGRIVFIGSSAQPVPVAPMQVVWRELRLLGSRGFVPADIEEAIALRLDGRIALDHLVGTLRPLEEAQLALDDLRAGSGLRTVLVP